MRKILKGGEYEKMRVRFYFVDGEIIFVIEKSTNEIKSHLKNGRKKKRYTLFYSVKILECQILEFAKETLGRCSMRGKDFLRRDGHKMSNVLRPSVNSIYLIISLKPGSGDVFEAQGVPPYAPILTRRPE